MGGASTELKGPDLAAGVALDEIADGGVLLGHAHGEAVVLARKGDRCFAVGATCTHYGGPLAEGLFDGEALRCPWHHACFSVETGAPVGAPALAPIAIYKVEESGGRVRVGDKAEPPAAEPHLEPGEVVIVGGGAAGHTVAETLRREGHSGRITIFTADEAAPVDRPNLSKDYLAGNAPEEWVWLKPREFYDDRHIELHTGKRVLAIDTAAHVVALDSHETRRFDSLVIATGATPIRLEIPGGDRILYLRSLADSRAIIARAEAKKRAVVIGASFIGLEVAASLRARGVEVEVVAPDARPLERVLGEAMGDFVRALHEAKGVRFHLGRKPASVEENGVTLDNGETLPADFVVGGIGVRPSLELAREAGIAVDNGILVDEGLQTSAPGVYAVGDVARWPDAFSGERIRVEHWVVAERQAQTCARNLLGRGEKFRAVPFFWSQHYDVTINYVGHGAGFDRVEVVGDLAARDALVAYRKGGAIVAVATVGRDGASLEAERAMERGDQAALERLVAH
jgi:NADPH-dependent 2,4-dienoyl-CoA reductase/sulfur reductase-like enzyme/nitrite reductase/ring-hydroxylating ferredoxin subunit